MFVFSITDTDGGFTLGENVAVLGAHLVMPALIRVKSNNRIHIGKYLGQIECITHNFIDNKARRISYNKQNT